VLPAVTTSFTNGRRSYVVGILALALCYVLTSELAIYLQELGAITLLLWVPSGIGLAVLLLYGRRWWPGIALGSFAAVALRKALFVGVVASFTETLEALLIYQLLRGARFRTQLDRVRDVATFVAADAATTLIGATVGATVIALADGLVRVHYIPVWSTWWWVNLSGDLIVTPALLTWLSPPRTRTRPSLEVLALAVVGAIVGVLVLGDFVPHWLPGAHSPYYLLPIMVWAGVRFGPRGAATATLLASLSALAAATVGPVFPSQRDVQLFIAISSVTTLLLSALAEERVTAVERRGAIQLAALDGIVTIDELGRVLELNPAAEQLFGVREADVLGKDLASLMIPPRLRDAYYSGLRRYAATGASAVIGARYRTTAWRASDGREFPVEVAVVRAPDSDQVVLTGFVRDVTAEYAAQAAREEAAATLERVVEERTAELRESLREGDMLLREIHHRVKNNLQVISSLLQLQTNAARDDAVRRVLRESQNRITAMALVHQLLYRSKEVARVEFGEYLRNLADRLVEAYSVRPDRISLAVDAEVIHVDLDTAIPCGLIINELVANALEHAFPAGRRGHILITLTREPDVIALAVSDDGIGLPLDIRVDAPTTFGLSIVRTLARQLEGTIASLPGPGTTIQVSFPTP
jgi:PAS domain S-box-containing protein